MAWVERGAGQRGAGVWGTQGRWEEGDTAAPPPESRRPVTRLVGVQPGGCPPAWGRSQETGIPLWLQGGFWASVSVNLQKFAGFELFANCQNCFLEDEARSSLGARWAEPEPGNQPAEPGGLGPRPRASPVAGSQAQWAPWG